MWAMVAVPTLLGVGVLYSFPSLFSKNGAIDAPTWLSIAGTAMSYYGLLFSLYAAISVQDLSSRYFAKIRSPDLIRKLDLICKSLYSIENEPSHDIKSKEIFYQIPVTLRATRKIGNSQVKRLISEAESAFSYFSSQVAVPRGPQSKSRDICGYWELFQKLSELADEAKEQIKAARAVE